MEVVLWFKLSFRRSQSNIYKFKNKNKAKMILILNSEFNPENLIVTIKEVVFTWREMKS